MVDNLVPHLAKHWPVPSAAFNITRDAWRRYVCMKLNDNAPFMSTVRVATHALRHPEKRDFFDLEKK